MIELFTLGSVDLRTADGREIRSVLAQPKRLAMLAHLAVAAPDGYLRRDTLLAMFWPESTDERARGAFRQAVYYLRRSLGVGVLANRAEDEIGIAQGTLRCDATEFRAALGRDDAASALTLYRGDLLDGLLLADAPEFERWLSAERAAFRAEAVAAAWTLANAAAPTDAGAALEWARRAVALAPLDEAGVRRRIALLDRAGDRAGAVQAYDEFARSLADELGLEPAPETRGLVEDIRRRETGLGSAAVPPVLPTRPLGEKDEDVHDIAPSPPQSGNRTIAVRPTRSRRRATAARTAIGVTVVVIALSALAYLAFVRSDAPPLEPRRVVVMPFANRTGDAALEPVANMAADWIIQGLAGRGALEVVPATAALATVLYLNEPATAPGGEPDPRPLARETGAGTAVSGSYYSQGDSIHFQARIMNAATGQVIAGIGPVGSHADAPLDAIDRLRQRVLANLAPLSDQRDTHIRRVQVARAPPSYGAYHAYVSGFEIFVRRQDMPGALRHFERAATLDSTFKMPAISAAIVHRNLGNYAAADSIAQWVNRSRRFAC